MKTAVFAKRVFLIRAVLLAALSQVLLLATCEEASQQWIKVVTFTNVPSAFEMSETAKTQLSEYDNLSSLFFQEGGESYLKSDALYLMALFIPLTENISAWYDFINEYTNKPDEALDYGTAYALMKIGKTTTQRIITLSKDAAEIGYYWEGDPDTTRKYGICAMLLTPDARFILRVDFSLEEYLGTGTQSQYNLDYNSSSMPPNLITVFTVVRAKGSQVPLKDNSAATLLPDNFIENLVDRFS